MERGRIVGGNVPNQGDTGPGRMAASGGGRELGESLRQALPAPAQAHLLHTAPGHSGEGVGHQPGAQASEQPYLPIHLHDVLGYKKAEGAVSPPHPPRAQTDPLLVTFTPRLDASCNLSTCRLWSRKGAAAQNPRSNQAPTPKSSLAHFFS